MNTDQIKEISGNVQSIIDQELKSTRRINELETKLTNLENSLYSPLTNGYANEEENRGFVDYLRKGVISPSVTKSLSTAAGEAGVVVTPTLNHHIIEAVKTKSVMRQIATTENISTNALDVVIEDGEFSSGWVGEDEARNVTNTPKLIKKSIYVHELYAQPKATQKLIDDAAIDLDSWLVERLAEHFIKAENEAFIVGNGDRKPFGILTNNNIERVDVGNHATPEALLKLINSLPEQYLANASLLMNRSTLAAIQGLKDNTGRFIWQQSLVDSLKQCIFGIPVYCSSHMPNVGDNNLAIAIGDFKTGYKIVDRNQIAIMRDPYTDKPFIKFYAVKRVGGDVVVPTAIKFAKFSA